MSAIRSWIVESESTPGENYEVKLFLEPYLSFKAGSFTCSCPAWRFQRRPVSDRTCKHIRWVQDEIEAHDQKFHAIEEVKGSAITFQEEAVVNGRLQGLIESIKAAGA